jgi:autotransporter-associated beta strand protein
MKLIIKTIAVMAGFLCAGLTKTHAVEFDVSPSGNDTNSGTAAQPFQTIARARDAVRSLVADSGLPAGGVDVLLHSGKYALTNVFTLTPQDSGQPGSTIRYRAAAGETPVITSATTLTGWQLYTNYFDPSLQAAATGHVWMASIPVGWRFHFLYLDGQPQPVARLSKTNVWSLWPTPVAIGSIGPGGQPLTLTAGLLTNVPTNGDLEMNLLPVNYWNTISVLTGINPTNSTCLRQSKNPTTFWTNSFQNAAGNYNLQNALKFLTQPGEWCVDSAAGKVFFWPPGDTLSGHNVWAPGLYRLIQTTNDDETLVHDIEFQGLTLTCTDRLPEDQWPDNWTKRQAELPDAMLYLQGVANCTIDGDTFSYSGSYCVALQNYAQGVSILGNEMAYPGCGGVQLQGYGPGTNDVNKYNLIQRNYIHHTGSGGYLHSAAVTLYQSGYNDISLNWIDTVPYCGISICGSAWSGYVAGTIPGAWDAYGNSQAQFNTRWNELPNGTNSTFTQWGFKPYLYSNTNRMSNNILTGYMSTMSDGGGLYSWSCGLGNLWENNLLQRTNANASGQIYTFIIYMDNYTDWATISNNVCWNTSSYNTFDNGNTDNTWVNNVVSATKPANYDLRLQQIAAQACGAGGWLNCPANVTFPSTASSPTPSPNQNNVAWQLTLTWAVPCNNYQQDLYFGTNAVAVANATTNASEYQSRLSSASYTPGTGLLPNTTYYWRVDEVVAGTNVATGTVWSFTTMPPPLVWNGNLNGTWDIAATANWKSNGVAAVYFDGNPVQFDDAASGATTVSNTVAVSPISIIVSNVTKNYTIGGSAISGSGTLTKAGGGTLTLSGANTYTGNTYVNAGQMILASPFAYTSALNTIGTGAVLVITNAANGNLSPNTTYAGAGVLRKNGAGTVGNNNFAVHIYLSAGGVIDWTAGDFNMGGVQSELLLNYGGLNIAAGATFHISDPAWQVDWLTGGGEVNNAYNNTTPTLTVGVAGTANNPTYGVINNTATFSGVIGYSETYNTVSVSSMSLVKVGAGTQILAGTNGYTLATTISGGTLKIGGAGLLGGGGYPGAITNNAAFIYNSSAAQTLSGVISGPGTLTQGGPGTLTLSGANNYSGVTTVMAGKLVISSAQTGTGAINVNDGAALGVTISGASQLSPAILAEGSSAGPMTNEFTGLISTTVAPVNVGTLTLKGTTVINVVSGTFAAGQSYPLISYATISGAGNFVLGALPAGVSATVVTNNNTIALNVSATPAFVWVGNVNGTWDITTTANWKTNGVAAKYLDGSRAVQFDDTASTFAVSNAATVSPAGIVVNNAAHAYTIGGSAIGGSGALVKSGANALTLASTANTFSGPITVQGGTLILSNFPVSGNGGTAVAGAAINLSSGATLTVNYASGVTKALSSLTGGGTFNLVGAGTYDPIYCGGTAQTMALSSGALWHVVSGTARLGYGYAAHWINNQASLTVDSGATFNLWDHVNDGNGICFDALNGAGIITETEGQANTLYLGVANGSGTFAGTLTDAGGANTLTLVKAGTGTQTFTGTNSYTGTTTVSNGMLLVNGVIGGGAVTVAGGTLGGTGVINGAVTVQGGGVLAPGTNSLGTLTVSNSLTLGGGTQMKLSLHASAATNDVLRCSGTVNFGGALVLTNIGTNALVVGNKFTLFRAAARTGAFASITWPALAPGLGWTNSLLLDGSVAVVPAVNTTPINLNFAFGGGQLTLNWPADHTGWRLQAQTNNLNLGLGTNWSDVAGATVTNQMNLPVTPANPAVFYRLVFP